MLNNLIWWFAGGITLLTEVSEPADPNRKCSLSKWASFPFTRNFSGHLGLGPSSEWAVEWMIQSIGTLHYKLFRKKIISRHEVKKFLGLNKLILQLSQNRNWREFMSNFMTPWGWGRLAFQLGVVLIMMVEKSIMAVGNLTRWNVCYTDL